MTQTYCSQRVLDQSKSTARILRSLCPEYDQKPAYGFEWDKEHGIELTNWNFEVLGDNFQIVKELFECQINQKKELIRDQNSQKFKGRVLVSEFEFTITDGVSEIESKGLIDGYDLPPIDTWFYITNDNAQVLFAWIPERFELEIDNAIQVNCLGLLSWLENWNGKLYNDL